MLPVYPLNSEQIEIQNLALDFANREIVPVKNISNMPCLDFSSLYGKISASGLVNTRIPTEFGGLGLSLFDTCLIIEQLAYACAGSACVAEASELAITYLLAAGSLEQKRMFIQPLAHDGALAGIALARDAWQNCSRQLVAKQKEGEFVLNGTCELVLNAQIAKWFLVRCSLVEQADHAGTNNDKEVFFIIPNGAPGLSLLNRVTYMGCQTADSWSVNFKNVCLESIAKIDIAEHTPYSINSAIIGSVCLGIANSAYSEAKRYAEQRKTFGVPISKHQIIAFMLADMFTDITALRLMIYDTVSTIQIANTKLALSTQDFALESSSRLTIEALQLFGAYGYTKDYAVAKIMQDAKTHQSFYGDRNFGKRELAQSLFTRQSTA